MGAVATIGMAALKRVELLIDREKGEAWLRPVKTPAPAYNHNRLGAVFTPAGPQGEDLLAHVAAGSPAAEAGIRDGDVLLKIGALDATKWRTDPQVLPLSRFWQRAAGTKFDLGIRRGSEVIHVNVTLRDILPPAKVGN